MSNYSTRVDAAKRYIIDLAERVLATAAETFVAVALTSGLLDWGHVTDVDGWEAAGIAAIAAGLAVVKGAVAKWIGDRKSASLAPSIGTAPSTPTNP